MACRPCQSPTIQAVSPCTEAVQLVGFELAAGVLFGGSVGTSVNRVTDASLRTAFDDHRPYIYFDPQNFCRSQRTIDFLAPGITLADDMCFLCYGQGRKQGQQANPADELWRTFQNKHLSF